MSDSEQPSRAQLTREVETLRAEVERLRADSEDHQETEERFRILTDHSPNMVFINQHGRVIYTNHKCSEVMGYSAEELGDPNFDFRTLIHDEDIHLVEDALGRHMGGEDVTQNQYRIVTRSGQEIDVINTSRLISYHGKPAILGMLTDVTELFAVRRALRETEDLYATLLQVLPDAVLFTSLEGQILAVNHQAALNHGFRKAEELVATDSNVMDWVTPAERDAVQESFLRLLEEGKMASASYTLQRVDGSRMPMNVNACLVNDEAGQPRGIIVAARDTTAQLWAEEERLGLERKLLHAQKLESLGVLAGGIAHDFNNLLTGILGNASLALHDMPREALAWEATHQIEMAAIRASDLTRQMLAYSGKGTFVVSPVEVNTFVQEMGQLLGASTSKKVSIRYELAPDLPRVEADAAQLQQVVMNLITNAAEAIGQEIGTIVIRTGLLQASEEVLRQAYTGADLPAGTYLELEVLDTGAGMDAETLARMFDPFFSTKFTGRGLGLAAVLGIVRSHSGALWVTSDPGRGTSFKILLPIIEEGRAAGEHGGAAPSRVDFRGSGVILIVDDEEIVREVATRMVDRLGFSFIAACDGRQGLEIFQARAAEITAVLLDLTMPEMSGEEVFREMRKIRPDVPIILSSGFDHMEAIQRFGDLDIDDFIQKPYQIKELADCLAKISAIE